MLLNRFYSKIAKVQLNKGVTLWPNECAVQSSNGPPFKNSMKNTSVLSAFNTKGQKCLMADLMSVVYTCCHFFPLRKRQITSLRGAWKKHRPVPGHWLWNSHRRTMKTWGHRTISSTHNLVGSLQFPLKNIISIMQGSARVFWRAGSALIFHTCPNHCLISSVSKGESKVWHRQRTRQVLHYIRSTLFLPVFSKCSRMTQFLQWIPTCLQEERHG